MLSSYILKAKIFKFSSTINLIFLINLIFSFQSKKPHLISWNRIKKLSKKDLNALKLYDFWSKNNFFILKIAKMQKNLEIFLENLN